MNTSDTGAPSQTVRRLILSAWPCFLSRRINPAGNARSAPGQSGKQPGAITGEWVAILP